MDRAPLKKWSIRLVKWALAGVIVYLILFKTPAGHYILPPLWQWLISVVETFFYVMWYIFMFCSIAMVCLMWAAWTNEGFRDRLNKYTSRLFAKDYYKGYKRPDYSTIIRSYLSKSYGSQAEVEDGAVKEAEKKKFYVDDKKSKFETGDIERNEVDISDKTEGRHTTRHPSGHLKSEYTIIDGKLEGVYRTYYEDGHVRQEKEYQGGKLTGIFKAYDESGFLYFEVSYKDGKQHGIENIYGKNGILQYRDTWKNGEKINRKTYSDSGELKSDFDYFVH